jgi:hypothetical protein
LNFFEVARLSLARQSIGIYSGKIKNGWPLILRNILRLLRRFNPLGRADR